MTPQGQMIRDADGQPKWVTHGDPTTYNREQVFAEWRRKRPEQFDHLAAVLTPEQMEAFELNQRGYHNRIAAETLGISVSAYSARLARARQRRRYA